METVVLIIHLMIAIALVITVLLQKSEGGAIGIGGGGGGGGFMTGRGAADALTSLTAMLAAAFFVTSITLTILSGSAKQPTSITDDMGAKSGGKPKSTGLGDLLPPKALTPAAPLAPPTTPLAPPK